MALKRISDYTDASLPLSGTEMLELETAGGSSQKCTVQDIADLASGPSSVSINDETASYTAVISDQVVIMDNASANNFTVPANASVAYPDGWFLEVWQKGAGQTTIVADTGVTILYHADNTLKLKGQNSGCSLRKVATNTWRLIGDMEPA
jgi:hypothetical protein